MDSTPTLPLEALPAEEVDRLRAAVLANHPEPAEVRRTEFVKALARAANGYGADVLRRGEIQIFADLLLAQAGAAAERAKSEATFDEAKALEHFADYFRTNYPGPDTIIGRPDWHSPKIFRAVLYAIKYAAVTRAETPELSMSMFANLADYDAAVAAETPEATREGASELTDDEILQVASNLFPMWREDIQPQFVLRVVRAALSARAGGEPTALTDEQISYPRDLFQALIYGNSPYAFYIFQWVPYQTDAQRWRLKMQHDVRTFDGREAFNIWPNGSSCGPFKDSEVEFIRISKAQFGEAWADPRVALASSTKEPTDSLAHPVASGGTSLPLDPDASKGAK